MTTNKQEHNSYRCQHNQRKQRATMLGCKIMEQATECEQYMMTMNNNVNKETTVDLGHPAQE